MTDDIIYSTQFYVNEQVFGSTELALKCAQIVNLCCKLSGFADFENRVDHGSAVIFLKRIPDCACLMFGPCPKRNLDHKSFFSLDPYVNEFIQIFSFFERSSFYVIGTVLRCCHQARCLLFYSGADPGEVKWVNFHPPFSEPSSFFFFLTLKY